MHVDTTRIATASRSTYQGSAFRQIATRYPNPYSGEGAKINGGRFNPPDSFPTLYLCTTRACCAAELRRYGERQVIGLAGLLPRTLYQFEVNLDRVLDLSSSTTLGGLGVAPDQITGTDWTLPQEIGEAAHATGWQALIAPSATGVDLVLAVYPQNLGSGQLIAEAVETWTRPDDI